MGDVGEVVRAAESLKNDTKIVDAGWVNVKGGRMSNVVEISAS